MKFKVIGMQVIFFIDNYFDYFKFYSFFCRQGFKFFIRFDGDVGDIDGVFWEINGVGVRLDV